MLRPPHHFKYQYQKTSAPFKPLTYVQYSTCLGRYKSDLLGKKKKKKKKKEETLYPNASNMTGYDNGMT